MSIYSTGVNPFLQQLITTSNILQYNLSKYTLNTSNALINNLTSIKQLIDGTSNTKIDSSGLQVYHKDILNPFKNGWVNVESRLETDKNDIITIKGNISGIDSTLTTIEGEIGTIQGEVTTNTVAIADITPIVAADTIAIAGLVPLAAGHTIAITALTIADGNSLKKANIDAGDIGLFQTVGGAFLNIVFNTNHFKDKAILATNREFNLNDEYANLPTTKNNKITWNSPLNYNIATDTASIDLSNYLTNVQTSNTFISSNSFFNNLIPNYVTNVSLSNQLYMSSNSIANLYISSNVASNILLNYVTNTALSNLFYMSSNAVNNFLLPYDKIIDRQNAISSLSNLYVSSNQIYEKLYDYSVQRQFPEKIYDSSTTETTTTFLGKSVYTQTFTLTTGVYSNGVYTLYSSSSYGASLDKKLLFNYNLSETTTSTHWFQGYTSGGVYNGTNHIVSNFLGDWIVIKLPLAIVLSKFRFYNRSGFLGRSPGLWRCYGSVDGITFTLIPEASNDINFLTTSSYSSGFYEKVLASSFQLPYTYIGFTISKLSGSDTLLNFAELQLFGSTEYSRPIYVSSNVLSNVLLPYDTIVQRQNAITSLSNLYISSNVASNILLNYVTNTALSNMFYMSSNDISSFYISSNTLFSNILPNYVTSNTDVINRDNTSNYIVSLNQQTSNILLNYVTSNTDVINRINTSNYISSLSNLYLTSNHLYDIYYSVERQYPEKVYDSSTTEITTTFLGKTVYTETITLNTGTYGNGDYILYSSTTYSASSTKKNLFNKINVENPTSLYPTWGLNNYPSGNYNGTNFIVSNYLGDWTIIKFPRPLVLTKFGFVARPSLTARAPGLWRCYGSMDGIVFTLIPEATNDVTRLTTTNYPSNIYQKTLNSTFNTQYLYIGFTINKLVSTDNIMNFAELQIFGKELIENPIYISSNVIPNILLPYDTIIDRQNAITSLSNLYISSNVASNILLNYVTNNSLSNLFYISSNTVENFYISSNNFYRGSNIVLEKPVKILNTGVDAL